MRAPALSLLSSQASVLPPPAFICIALKRIISSRYSCKANTAITASLTVLQLAHWRLCWFLPVRHAMPFIPPLPRLSAMRVPATTTWRARLLLLFITACSRSAGCDASPAEKMPIRSHLQEREHSMLSASMPKRYSGNGDASPMPVSTGANASLTLPDLSLPRFSTSPFGTDGFAVNWTAARSSSPDRARRNSWPASVSRYPHSDLESLIKPFTSHPRLTKEPLPLRCACILPSSPHAASFVV